jgi:MoaA/NifB/PqqE/SkfB family radical SAM enzyme
MRLRDDAVRFNYDKRSLLEFGGRRLRALFGKPSPMLAYVKVTKRCNLDCGYCPWHTAPHDFTGERTTADWKVTLDDIIERGARILIFEGGEPTLRRDLQELLDHAHARGAYTVLATNGTTDMNRFAPSAFTVSVDGPERVHDTVRGVGTFQRTLANIAAHRGPERLVVITVISRVNQEYLEELVEQVGPLVDGFLFTFVYPYSDVVADVPSPAEVVHIKQRLMKLKKHFRIMNPARQLRNHSSTWRCYDWLTMSVDHKGVVREGCFVDHVEPKQCDKCELGCYQVISALHEFNFESWFNLHRLLLARV